MYGCIVNLVVLLQAAKLTTKNVILAKKHNSTKIYILISYLQKKVKVQFDQCSATDAAINIILCKNISPFLITFQHICAVRGSP